MSWSSHSKCCLTCVNWAGQRTIKYGHAETTSPGERGKCYAGVFCSVTQGPTAMSGNSCNKYSKWPAIK